MHLLFDEQSPRRRMFVSLIALNHNGLNVIDFRSVRILHSNWNRGYAGGTLMEWWDLANLGQAIYGDCGKGKPLRLLLTE